MASFKVTNIDEIREQAGSRADAALLSILREGIQNASEVVIDDVIDVMSTTDTWRGIRGDFNGSVDQDIQAHMGLTSSDAAQALEEIEEAVRQSFSIELSGIRGRASTGRFSQLSDASSAQVFISFPNIQEAIVSIRSGSYASDGGEVPWMSWLLNGGSVPGYQISFDLTGRFEATSRSGRAVMWPSNITTWDTSDYGFGFNDNFVIETFNKPELLDRITRTITSYIRGLAG